MNIEKSNRNKLSSILNEEYGFVVFASFEERCLTVSNALEECKIKMTVIFCNCGTSSVNRNSENVDAIIKEFSGRNVEVHEEKLNLDVPVSAVEGMLSVVDDFKKREIKNLLVDISTFTHEALLIMMKILKERDCFDKICYLYNGASTYSVGDKTEEVWLSKGCRDVRNVIGYSGILDPSKKNHLIVLSGFEMERATKLMEILEPDALSLGNGTEPTDGQHEESMNYFYKKLSEWRKSVPNAETDTFEFSCSDVSKTVEKLENIIADDNNKNENFILAPLNTKVSTIAVGLVALRNENVQVCYAIPEMYNTANYSTPSDNILVIEFEKSDWYSSPKST